MTFTIELWTAPILLWCLLCFLLLLFSSFSSDGFFVDNTEVMVFSVIAVVPTIIALLTKLAYECQINHCKFMFN